MWLDSSETQLMDKSNINIKNSITGKDHEGAEKLIDELIEDTESDI